MEKSTNKKKEKETTDNISLGSLLRKAREERHIELDEIFEVTRIRRHNLEALENEEWSKLPSQIFVKGFLRSYAEFLGLDKETIIHHYMRTSSFQKSKPEVSKKIRPQSGRPYLIIIIPVLALALIIALIYLNRSNISIIEKVFQYLGTQSPVEKKGNIPERVANKGQDNKEKEILIQEDERVVDEESETALKSKPIDDAIVHEGPTIPLEKKAEKPLSPKFILTANVNSRTWIAIFIDDKPIKEYLFQPGQTPRWTADKGFNILVGNAGGVEFFLNGKEVGYLGTKGQVVRIKLPEG